MCVEFQDSSRTFVPSLSLSLSRTHHTRPEGEREKVSEKERERDRKQARVTKADASERRREDGEGLLLPRNLTAKPHLEASMLACVCVFLFVCSIVDGVPVRERGREREEEREKAAPRLRHLGGKCSRSLSLSLFGRREGVRASVCFPQQLWEREQESL